MQHIPHSTFEDEARFIVTITDLIKKKELRKFKKWDASVKDEKAKLVRQKQGEKEAKEAEEMAKELGVWDEFFGSGKPSSKKGRGKGKAKAKEDTPEDEEDYSALQAMILKKRKNTESFFDNLAAKYADADDEPSKVKGKKGRGKKRAKADEDDEEEVETASPKKKSRKAVPPPPDIDDAEFEALQQKLFGDKGKGKPASTSKEPSDSKPKRSTRTKKTK